MARSKAFNERRRTARRRQLHALERLEARWESASPDEADEIAAEADALARKVTPYSRCPKRKEAQNG